MKRPGQQQMIVCNQLRLWRARWRLTQAQAAVALGVTLASIRNWEQRRSNPEGLALESLRHKLTQRARR